MRIEYCQDTDGFWLEPHCDIAAKRFTMLIYLSDDPPLHDAGTDIYDDTQAHHRVASVPYYHNTGLIFIPSANSWHGFTPHPINGLRTTLIIDYVAPDWRATEELADPTKAVALPHEACLSQYKRRHPPRYRDTPPRGSSLANHAPAWSK